MNYDTLFINPNGRTPREQYIPAMITVLAVMAFYAWFVTGRTAQFCVLVLLYPAFVVLTRRLRDMGLPAWSACIPLALLLVSFINQLGYMALGATLATALQWLAGGVAAAVVIWAAIGPAREAGAGTQ